MQQVVFNNAVPANAMSMIHMQQQAQLQQMQMQIQQLTQQQQMLQQGVPMQQVLVPMIQNYNGQQVVVMVPTMQPAVPVAPIQEMNYEASRSSSSDPNSSSAASVESLETGSLDSQAVSKKNSTEGRNLIVNGLASWMDADWLEETFKKFGELEKTHVVCDISTNKSKGYGFVQFASLQDANKATAALNGTIPAKSGKILKVSIARAQETSQEKKTVNVYFAGFKNALTASDLQTMCRKYGEVVDCKVLCHRQHSDGVAFIKFSTIASAEACCAALNKTVFTHPASNEKLNFVVRFADKLGKSRQSKHEEDCPKLLRNCEN
eukprot:TRINITY_DN24908_c0_g1_i1.p1 TRINITY_DN24908_c0_g1~~TRINITY_DN24908_c0_g1_i1.p1  ORF type:complete len:321 (+),score=101.13 TRINITY_DN24908_c0_g1_i1:70-1032(+)